MIDLVGRIQFPRSVRRRNVDVGLRSSSSNLRLVSGIGPWRASADARWKPGERATSFR